MDAKVPFFFQRRSQRFRSACLAISAIIILCLCADDSVAALHDYCRDLKLFRIEVEKNFLRRRDYTQFGPCRTSKEWSGANKNALGITGYSSCYLELRENLSIPVLPSYVQFLKLAGKLQNDVSEDLFSNVNHLNLVYLDLSLSSLRVIQRGAFRWINNLKCLNIAENPRLDPLSFQEVLTIPGLEWLDASNCDLPIKIVAPMINTAASLQILSLTSNFVENPLYGNANWTEHFKHLTNLFLSNVGSTAFVVQTVSRLQYLNLSHNRIYIFPKTCTQSSNSLFPNLTTLILSFNTISQINGFLCLTSLRHLDLSHNEFLQLDRLNLPLRHLITLKLSWNRIRAAEGRNIDHGKWLTANTVIEHVDMDETDFTLVDEDRFLQVFGHLRSLKTLSLSHTQLGLVTSNMFAPLVNLTALWLDKNVINNIPDGCFDSMTQLKKVYLSFNAITTVTATTFSAQTRERLTDVILSNNPFLCTCDLLPFRDWYLREHDKFHRKLPVTGKVPLNHYQCTDVHGHSTAMVNFTLVQQACFLSRQASVLLIVVQTLMITSMTAFILLFRYRWQVRLMLFEAFRGRGDTRRRYLEAGHFQFDVFVSYSTEQLPWVRNHLMPRLEGNLGLRLCVHERDFIPGAQIVENISDCVESSKKVMMVFTKDFVLSPWCQFELAYCLSHVMEHEDALVVVCLDDVASRDMTPAMMAVLKTTTYIQWEDGADAVESFWGRLDLALHEVLGRQRARPAPALRHDEHEV